MSGIRQSLEEMCPYVYETAVSPHLASRIEGNPVQMETVLAGFQKVCEEYEYVTMEEAVESSVRSALMRRISACRR